MAIGLQLAIEQGKLVGTLESGHGDWDVTDVAEKNGVWTAGMAGLNGDMM
jgi:hypothetical protein